jgi:hypothetical protein
MSLLSGGRASDTMRVIAFNTAAGSSVGLLVELRADDRIGSHGNISLGYKFGDEKTESIRIFAVAYG